MICPKCHQPIVDGSNYCHNCGTPMSRKSKKADISSMLLFIWVVAVCLCNVILYLYTSLVDEWWNSAGTVCIYYFVLIFENLLSILPALAIRHRVLRIVGIVFMGLFTAWWILNNIMNLVNAVKMAAY